MIAVLGFGTVGSGVVEVLEKNSQSIASKCGQSLKVKRILDIRDFPERTHMLTKNIDDILNDDDITIVVEAMGGTNPAYLYTKRALELGKNVVTSNKEVVATYGAELLALAREKNVLYLFEASVGGGIPIIKPLHDCLAANEITEITGILNGTTNYILTKMAKERQTLQQALSDAQQKGYAEADPTADVEGYDSGRKIAILSSLAFGRHVNPNNIYIEGIMNIDARDIVYAAEMGMVIKLLGISRKIAGDTEANDKIYIRVCPAMLKADHPLAGVEDVFNGILVKGDAIGEVMFYGRGAGKLPTASAVVADVIDIVKNNGTQNRIMWADSPDQSFVLSDDLEKPPTYFVRSKATNNVAAIEGILKCSSNCTFAKLPSEDLAFLTDNVKGVMSLDCLDSISKTILVCKE